MRRLRLCVFATLLAALTTTSTRATELATLPEVLPNAAGITTVRLTVDAARLTVTDGFTFTTRAYYYQDTPRVHGPVIKVVAGGVLDLTLVNNLLDDSAIDATKESNDWRHSNTTNIHTHGLHVDPAIDSIFRHATPGGGTLAYSIPIPDHHAPGLHWYHAHTHGSSSMQLMGGLVGAIYVMPKASDNIPAVFTDMTSHIILMQHFQFAAQGTQSCDPQAANFNPFQVFSFAELEAASGSLLASNPSYVGDDREFLTLNGVFRPTLTMQPSESRLLKLVHAAGALAPLLHFPSGCTATNIAFDGVYLSGAPREVTQLQLVTGSRVEVVLSCSAAGSYDIIATNTGNIDRVPTTSAGGDVVMTVVVSGSAVSAVTLPTSLDSITRPWYLSDMTTLAQTNVQHHVSLSQAGADLCKYQFGQGTNCVDQANARPGAAATNTCPTGPFGGSRGLATSGHVFSMEVNQTAEFIVTGAGNNPHPLHIHINHFQIQGYSGSDAVRDHWFRVGDWRDTIPALDGQVTIRFPAADLTGETVMHCHILNHEDRGLMDTFLITPSTGISSDGGDSTSSAAAAFGGSGGVLLRSAPVLFLLVVVATLGGW